jgi:hypothetical protein
MHLGFESSSRDEGRAKSLPPPERNFPGSAPSAESQDDNTDGPEIDDLAHPHPSSRADDEGQAGGDQHEQVDRIAPAGFCAEFIPPRFTHAFGAELTPDFRLMG